MSDMAEWRRLPDGRWEKINPDGTRSILWGVAGSGQPAKEGTVEQVDHPSGRMDAIVRPGPVSVGIGATGFGPKPDDFVREPDALNIDLAELEEALVKAISEGKVRYEMIDGKRAKVNFEDFRRWLNGL